MTKDEILALLNENTVCFLATADGDQPRVRGMALYRADEDGIIFHTGAGKDMALQMEKNPKVEVCAFDQKSNTQVRVAGTVEFLDDMALKQQMVVDRPFLKPIVDAVGYDFLLVFRVKDCVATVWTMEANLAPKTFVKLSA